MNKLTMALVLLSTALFSNMAVANPLANTTWQTYEGDQPKAVIKFVKNSMGGVDGTIQSTTRPEGKKLIGTTVVKNLMHDGGKKFSDGYITDPENGITYSLSATLNGTVLKLSGHYGPFSRSQTWKKK